MRVALETIEPEFLGECNFQEVERNRVIIRMRGFTPAF